MRNPGPEAIVLAMKAWTFPTTEQMVMQPALVTAFAQILEEVFAANMEDSFKDKLEAIVRMPTGSTLEPTGIACPDVRGPLGKPGRRD